MAMALVSLEVVHPVQRSHTSLLNAGLCWVPQTSQTHWSPEQLLAHRGLPVLPLCCPAHLSEPSWCSCCLEGGKSPRTPRIPLDLIHAHHSWPVSPAAHFVALCHERHCDLTKMWVLSFEGWAGPETLLSEKLPREADAAGLGWN